ncbi:MAG: hypothetical protein QXJ75_00925 [Candidatus Bathyarchaeia archaeon]
MSLSSSYSLKNSKAESAKSRELLTAILRLTNSKEFFTIKELSEESLTPQDLAEDALELLVKEKLAVRDGSFFKIEPAYKVLIAVKAVRLGADAEGVSRHISWREFEQFIEYALNFSNYLTTRHHYFKSGRKRYEVDVVGVCGQIVVAVDCKHWSSNWKHGEIKKSALAQLERVRSLSSVEGLNELAAKLRVGLSGWIYVTPVVATFKETAVKVYAGVPIVPVYKFGAFLGELLGYLPYLSTFRVNLSEHFP